MPALGFVTQQPAPADEGVVSGHEDSLGAGRKLVGLDIDFDSEDCDNGDNDNNCCVGGNIDRRRRLRGATTRSLLLRSALLLALNKHSINIPSNAECRADDALD